MVLTPKPFQPITVENIRKRLILSIYTMMRLRPYISVLLALALTAGPWLQVAATTCPVPSPDYCNCCQGPCHGCCCSIESEAPAAPIEPVAGHEACGCDMSSSPLPSSEVPIETVQVKVDERPLATTTRPLELAEKPDLPMPLASERRVPQADESPPLFILNASFLI